MQLHTTRLHNTNDMTTLTDQRRVHLDDINNTPNMIPIPREPNVSADTY